LTLLVDRAIFRRGGRRYAHLISDRSLEELHEGARRLGLDHSFHRDHYDVPEERLPEVLAAGVRQVDPRVIVVALRHAGLRSRRRNGA
jgi:signal recognition particle subunit SEC65